MKHLALDPDVAEVLVQVAAALGETPEVVARKALLRYLEDAEDGMAAERAMREFDPRDTISLEEVMRGLGMDDQLQTAGSKAA